MNPGHFFTNMYAVEYSRVVVVIRILLSVQILLLSRVKCSSSSKLPNLHSEKQDNRLPNNLINFNGCT